MRAPLAALALVLATLAALPGPAVAYTPSSVEPDPYIGGNVTIGAHLATYGTFDYTDDAGLRATIPGAVLDGAVKEPVNLSWTKVYAPNVLQENAIGTNVWTDTARWTLSTTGTPPTCTLTQDTIDGAGKALRMKAVAAGGLGSCVWSFDVDPDFTGESLAKLRFVVGVDVVALSPEATEIQAEDTGVGEQQTFRYSIESDATLGCFNPETTVIATAAASVFEQRTLWAPDCGSGSLVGNSVDKLNVIPKVNTGQTVELRITALALRAAAHSLGSDGDGNAVTRQVQADSAGVGLAVLAPTFAFSRMGDVRLAFRQPASSLPGDRATASYDGSSRTGSYRFEFGVPTAVDLTYGALKAHDPLRVSGEQVRVATWGGESVLGAYSGRSKGDLVLVRSVVSAGATTPFVLEVGFTEEEWREVGRGGSGGIIPILRDATAIILVVAGIVLLAWFLLRRRRQRRGREDREVRAPGFIPLLPLDIAGLGLSGDGLRNLIAVLFLVLIFAALAYLALRGRVLAGVAGPSRRVGERREARSGEFSERAAEARIRQIRARERVREEEAAAKARRARRRKAAAFVLAIGVGIVAVLAAAAIARPIPQEEPGTFHVLSHPCTRDIITCGFEDVVKAVTDAMRWVILAFAGIFVSIFNALGAAFATAVTILIVSPFLFLKASFDEAIRGLAGLGLVAPWAWGIIAIGFFIFAWIAVILFRAMIGALIPGELEETE